MRSLFERVQRVVPRIDSGTWILGYHLVEGGTNLAIDLPGERFVAQLDALAEQVRFVSLSALVEEVWHPSSAIPNDGLRVVLTFDDAFLNFYDVVLPLLRERGLPAILYVPTGFVNGDGDHPLSDPILRGVAAMTWEHVAEAQSAGIEIGSHTRQHANLVTLAPDLVADEFAASQLEIEARLGTCPSSICYPRSYVTSSVAKIASGFYTSGVVGGGLPIHPGVKMDPLRLPRLPVRREMAPDVLLRLIYQRVSLREWLANKARCLRSRRL